MLLGGLEFDAMSLVLVQAAGGHECHQCLELGMKDIPLSACKYFDPSVDSFTPCLWTSHSADPSPPLTFRDLEIQLEVKDQQEVKVQKGVEESQLEMKGYLEVQTKEYHF